jgi:hypothetical protein
MSHPTFKNPFKPGAGHMPPYLAGRQVESGEFERLLKQETILENLVLTGLRGIGKTVLLEMFKPLAIQAGWLWAGTDLSESTSINEESLAIRLLTDLSVVTSTMPLYAADFPKFGFSLDSEHIVTTLNFDTLRSFYSRIPGLASDKLKGVLEIVWSVLQKHQKHGIIFAYDEAQNLADHAEKDQYPLSLILDVFQSIQRKDIPFMLALTGLPTLFPKLVEARTFSERMFRVIFLDPLTEEETQAAILTPIANNRCPVKFSLSSVQAIWKITRGYPYFVQYVCREIYDVWLQNVEAGQTLQAMPVNEIMRKLDSDFFAGRWARATDRQRDLLEIVSTIYEPGSEFTVQEVVEATANKDLAKPFSGSHVNQLLGALSEAGLVYKNRHGKYSFAVPLLGDFIHRQAAMRKMNSV